MSAANEKCGSPTKAKQSVKVTLKKSATEATTAVQNCDYSPVSAKHKNVKNSSHSSSKQVANGNASTDDTQSIKPIANESSPLANVIPTPSTPKKNAFELMMTARSKVIGSNSPGKALNNSLLPRRQNGALEKSKRKVILQEWADRKGAHKRKLDELETEVYVDRQMNKRAKRLKNLLSNGKKVSTTENEELTDGDAAPVKRKSTKKPVTVNRKRRIKKLSESSDDERVSAKGAEPTAEPKKASQKTADIVEVEHDSPAKTVKVSPKTRTTTVVKIDAHPSPTATTKPPDNFTNVLSSPVKKRDSLLGYFSKIKSADDEAIDEVMVVTDVVPIVVRNKRGRPRKSVQPPNETVTTRECTPPPIQLSDDAKSPNTDVRRSKRERRTKITSYKIDIDDSPVKVAAKKAIKLAKRRLSGSPLRMSPAKNPFTSNSIPAKPFDRLAPIFVKAPVKPVVDPAIAKARHLFLMSGIPECMKLEIDKQRAYEETFAEEIEFFPSVSHVQQLLPPNTHSPTVPTQCQLKLRTDDELSDDDDAHSMFACGPATVQCYRRRSSKNRSSCTVMSKRPKQLIKRLKENDSNFLYNRCYNQLLEKRNLEGDTPTPIDESPPVTDIIDLDNSVEINADKSEPTTAKCGAEMFTEQYKPCTVAEILVNSTPAIELKKFLTVWLDNDTGRRDSSDDFSNSRSGSMSMYSKVVVLVGAPGTGKTNAVYAVANELNFKVLEINFSSKRSGKKMLKKLQEATQSHQVKSQASASQKLFDSEPLTDEGGGGGDENRRPALILIEDADIVFEQDLGFVDAIQQLCTVSKRPVILVANQRSCAHLQRYMGQNTIEFATAKAVSIAKWLSTLSIVEMCYIPYTDCERLYTLNKRDLRRTLLEIQFFIQSSGGGGGKATTTTGTCNESRDDQVLRTQSGLVDFYTRDQNADDDERVSLPLNFTAMRQKTSKMFESDGDEATSIDTILEFYRNITVAERLQCGRYDEDGCFGEDLSGDIARALASSETVRQRVKLDRLEAFASDTTLELENKR